MKRTTDHLATYAHIGFTEDLFRLMSAKGMSQRSLAAALGVSEGHISKVINGQPNLQVKTMARIALALGAMVDVRLTDEHTEVTRVLTIDEAIAHDDKREAESATPAALAPAEAGE